MDSPTAGWPSGETIATEPGPDGGHTLRSVPVLSPLGRRLAPPGAA
ncbi:hypothetical protein [Streptosporangium vulgare]|uniref:Uncharacterized protein n=1 Tax=Streptosporangium vulgare TaxID=46190 RepID=A0ABV5TSC0_9ACTN